MIFYGIIKDWNSKFDIIVTFCLNVCAWLFNQNLQAWNVWKMFWIIIAVDLLRKNFKFNMTTTFNLLSAGQILWIHVKNANMFGYIYK